MSGKFLAMIVFIYVLIAFLGMTFEGNWISHDSSLQTMANVAQGSQTLSFFGIIQLPVPPLNFFVAAYQIITLQFSFITGGYMMFYYIVLLPIAIAGVSSMIMLFIGTIRGNISWG